MKACRSAPADSIAFLSSDFHKRDEVFFRLGIIYKLQGKADASLDVSLIVTSRSWIHAYRSRVRSASTTFSRTHRLP